MENEVKKEKKFKAFVKMLLLFFFMFITVQIIAAIFKPDVTYKYGETLLGEMVSAMVLTMILLVINKGNIFTEKRTSFKKTIILDIPMIIIIGIVMCFNVIGLDKVPELMVVRNLFAFCICIGIFEELLFRGWIQNWFCNKLENTRKGAIWSILLASILFGLFHSTNILMGQEILQTVFQIIQTIAIGAFLGTVYYRTKNIWNVILLHGIYDFSVMLGNANYLKDPVTTNNISKEMLFLSIFATVISILIYTISCALMLRKSEMKQLVADETEMSEEETKIEKKKSKKLIACLVLVFIVFLCITIVEDKIPGYDDYVIVYEYNEKEVKDFTTTYFHKKDFEISTDNCQFKVYLANNNGQIIIKNMKTNYKINLCAQKMGNISVFNAEVIENENNFIILYYDYMATQNESATTLNYINIPKDSISDGNEFLFELRENIKTFEVPKADDIGYLIMEDSNYKYPFVNTTVYDKFIIDENDELFVISQKNVQ